MIYFTFDNASIDDLFADEIRINIDSVMNTDIFIYVYKSSQNIIYNSIRDSITGKTCYPDMIIKHNFMEASISDNSLYIIADDAIRRFGSSRCYFLSISDINSLSELVSAIKIVFDSSNPTFTPELLQYSQAFGEMLMLSTTMMHSFINLLTYYHETGGSIYSMLEPFTQEYALPVSNKKEGKIIYELIRKQILG